MRVLSGANNSMGLCKYALTPMDGRMHFDIARIVPLLSPGIGHVVARIFTQPADFQKEFTAWHTWQWVARKQAGAAYEVSCTFPITPRNVS
jgi:hypothetical protein